MDDVNVADIKRGSVARNAKLAGLAGGMAGRAALGFGKRLAGKPKEGLVPPRKTPISKENYAGDELKRLPGLPDDRYAAFRHGPYLRFWSARLRKALGL